MENIRAKIIWIDDEINHLKSHIISLENKGYQVSSVSNGWDAITEIENNTFDLVLLDHFMPGLDGIDTLRRLKEIAPNLPVIMITKSEEEWLMDEAISEQVAEYLIKPVNPSQIFSAIKRVLEKRKIIDEKTTGDYLKEFQKIDNKIHSSLEIEEWWELYNKLVKWQITFDNQKNYELDDILEEQIQSCNREFTHFINKNYPSWMASNEHPILSPEIIPKFCLPSLENKEKICLFVIDCLRHDHLLAILPEMSKYYNLKIDFALSILPTATPFARNAIFSGLYPDELFLKYPKQQQLLEQHLPHQNKYETDFLENLLIKNNLKDIHYHYHKIWNAEEGIKLANRLTDLYNNKLIAIVINFIDLLAHKRSESNILKEMVPNESGYRQAVRNWFENSWFFDILRQLAESDYKVIITSDHGSVRVQKDVLVAADRGASTGVRYKYGRNLNCSDKNALVIKDPQKYRLPKMGPQSSYLIAKSDAYFVYPNQQTQYQSLYKDSFQHGGISMEEMLIPVATLERK